MTAADALILVAIGGAAILLVYALAMIGKSRRERAQFEQQLRDSEARSRAVTEGMADAVVTAEFSGKIVDANRAAFLMFGYPPSQLIGGQIVDLIPTRHREALARAVQRLVEREERIQESERAAMGLRADGTEFPARLAFGDVRIGSRRLLSVILRDVTEQESIAEALRESEAQMRQITDNLPALIAVLDRKQRFVFHNRAYEEFLGVPGERIRGRPIRDVLGDEIYESIRPRIEEVLRGYPVRYERLQRNARGEVRDMQVHYFPRVGDGGSEDEVTGYYVLVTDVTDLRRVDRMKSEFVSIVSHELRTPLTSIRGSLGLIAGGVAGEVPDAARGLVDIANKNCERLIRLINDILDSEKIESGKMRFDMRVMELRPLVEQVIASNEGFAAQHEVRIELEAPAEPLRASIDADRFSQVLTNLVSNAVKFSPAGTPVTVTLARAGGAVRVEVRDRGPGIPRHFQARIFQKFSQADSSDSRAKGGTGLGLSIAKAIVERLGGTIGFSSKPGEGTTFFFELPESPSPLGEGRGEGQTSPSPSRERAGERVILIVEDDLDIARLIVLMLDKAGFKGTIARSAQEARQRLREKDYAALTVDLRLPDEHGISLIRSLRADEKTRNLPIVVVSATADENRIKLNDEALTVTAWMQKPIDENRLVMALRRAIGDGDVSRPWILHVEDDPDIQRVAAAIAQDFAQFEFAATLREAREWLRRRRFDLVLLDLSLPDGSGWDLLPDLDQLDPRPALVIFSASDVSASETAKAQAVLVKARTSNADLLETIHRSLKRQ